MVSSLPPFLLVIVVLFLESQVLLHTLIFLVRGKWRQKDHWTSLAYQPSQVNEFRVQLDILYQNNNDDDDLISIFVRQ